MRRALAVMVIAWAAPAAAVRDRGDVVVAAAAGANFPEPYSALGASFFVGVEVGWVLPVWRRWLAIVADGWVSAPEASGSVDSAQVGGTYRWHLTERQLCLGLSLAVRHSFGRWTPQLAVGPRLLVLDGVVAGTVGATHPPDVRDTDVQAGGAVVPSLGVTLGPGQVFVELPLTFAPGRQKTTGPVNASSIALAAGYRVMF